LERNKGLRRSPAKEGFQRRTAVADPVALRRIGLAFSGVVAIVVVVAAMTVSASGL
jgi:hypothetical protein